MSGFDTIMVVDWSARAAPSPAKPSPDSIWIAVAHGGDMRCSYHRTRDAAMRAICVELDDTLAKNQRILVGFDFPFGYPRGFARAVCGSDDPLRLWSAIARRIEDGRDNANNRFAVAGDLNRLFAGIGPFWGCPANAETPDLPARGSLRRGHGIAERRRVERISATGAQSVWKLYTAGSVGSQALLGIARLAALREKYGAALHVAPFQQPGTPIVLAEVYPSLLSQEIEADRQGDEILDRAQVRITAKALAGLAPALLDTMLTEGDTEEGWITGADHLPALRAALAMPAPPPLRNDCFALPPGVDWTPVDTALAQLRSGLAPVAARETLPIGQSRGRILCAPVHALRANPPVANSAVDGFAFAGPLGAGPHVLPLHPGRAAAGGSFDGEVPENTALRILTGAAIPPGTDTVALDEDVRNDGTRIALNGPLKRGANARRAGEDVTKGAALLPAGRALTPADVALLCATGIGRVEVHAPLRVAVLSTGDELVEPGAAAGAGQIYDANRPMLLAMLARWGMRGIDMGRVPDDRAALRRLLDSAAAQGDAIVTSGGASAGDEDHVSALLRSTGSMQQWRIAVKPGRPLALGMWHGKPVFGLPGNPVAAMICTLIFARPALLRLGGAAWTPPQAFTLPAAFEKRKKAGRREYLRARLRDGKAEVFTSEGSGRISGLSWADGLVELDDPARHIRPDDPVRYLPFASFGL